MIAEEKTSDRGGGGDLDASRRHCGRGDSFKHRLDGVYARFREECFGRGRAEQVEILLVEWREARKALKASAAASKSRPVFGGR